MQRLHLETFRRSPVGNQSHPVEPGRQPEARLASWQVTARAKRRQPVLKPCYGAPRAIPARALGLLGHGGRAEPPQWPGGIGLAGVEEHGKGTAGFPRNLGRPTAPSRQPLAGDSQPPMFQAPGRRRRACVERRTQATREGIAKRSINQARREGP